MCSEQGTKARHLFKGTGEIGKDPDSRVCKARNEINRTLLYARVSCKSPTYLSFNSLKLSSNCLLFVVLRMGDE